MVDFRPLLFVNALILMLLVTAGFASLQSKVNGSGELAQDTGSEKRPVTAIEQTGQPQTPDTSASTPDLVVDGPFADTDGRKVPKPAAAASAAAPSAAVPKDMTAEPMPVVADIELLRSPAPANVPVEVATVEIDDFEPESAAESEPVAEPEPDAKPEPKPTMGSLVVRSNVYGDNVSINGRDYGSTRLDLELTPGRYHVFISKAGHQTWENTVQLSAGDTRSLNAELTPFQTVDYRDGNWRGGIVSGEGTYEDADGLRYEGGFRNRQFHGEGRAQFPDGSKYTGRWANGEPDGRGTLRLKKGDIYAGQFAKGVYSGEGTLTTADGDIYTGNWADGRLNGQGTLTSSDGILYVGSFLKGEFHGEGTLTYPDGRYYEGGFADGKYHGKGTLIFADGKKYEGQFMEGQYHGQGDMLNPNGSRITGNFRYGEPYGQAKLTTSEGEIFTARTNEPGVCYRENSYRATQCPPMPGW